MARSSNSRPQAEGWVRRSTRTTKKPERLGQARQHEQPGSYYPRADVVRACIEHGIELQIMNLGDFGPVYPLPRDRNPNIGVYGPFWLPPIDVPDTTTPQITIGSSPAPLTSQNLLSLASDTPQHEADLPSTDQRAESSKDTFVLSSDSELTPVPEPSPPRETSDDKPEGRSPQAALAEGSGAKTSRTVTATATFPKGFLRRYTVLLNDLAEEIEGLRQNNRLSEELDDEDLEEWCICRMGDIDENGSVKCDNPNCSVGWYHQGCLNHRDRILHQKYELWLCTICLNGRLKALHAEEEEAGNNEIEQAEPCFDNYPDDPFVLSASSDLRDTDEIPPNSLEVEARQEASWNNDEYEARGSQAQSLQSLIPTSPSLHGPGIEAPILHTTSLQPPMPAIASNAPPTPLETQWSTATSTQQSTTASIRQSSVYVPHPSKISLSVMNALGLSLSAKRWTSPASTVVKEPDQDSMHVKYKHNMNLPDKSNSNYSDHPRFCIVCQDIDGYDHRLEIPVKLLLFFSRTLQHANVEGLCNRAADVVGAVRIPLTQKETMQHAVDFLKGESLCVRFGPLDAQVTVAEKERLLNLVHVAHALAIEPLMHAAVHALCTSVLRRPQDWADVVANGHLLKATTFLGNPARRLLGSVGRHSVLPTVTGWITLACHQEDRDRYCEMADRTCQLKGAFSPEIRLRLESFEEISLLDDDEEDDV